MTRRKVLWGLAAVLLAVLQLLLQANADRAAQAGQALGVTLAAPMTAEQLAAARSWETDNAETGSVAASFWGSTKAAVTSDFGRTAGAVTCIGFDGNAADCLPAVYQHGTAPGAAGQQCAVSSALAWALFGGDDVVGQCVLLDRTQYFICGVFADTDSVLLYPARSGFTHAALRGTSPATPRADAAQWAAAAGAGEVTALDYAPQKAQLAQLLCGLPLLLAGLCLAASVLRFLAGLPPLARGAGYFAAALVFALAQPHALQALPGWLIPSRWSNFAFWGTLWQELSQR